MKSKHTPGPWKAYMAYNERIEKVVTVEAEGNEICTVHGYWIERDSNAQLIASAPELLEVLQDIVEMQERNYGDGMTTHLELIKLSKRAKELIKKATGDE